MQERITGLHFFFFLLLFLDSVKRALVRGVLCSQRMLFRSVGAPVFATVHLSSVYIHSKLYMLVFIFFFQIKKTMNFITSYVVFLVPGREETAWQKSACRLATRQIILNDSERRPRRVRCHRVDAAQRQDSQCVILCSITWQWGCGESELLTGEGEAAESVCSPAQPWIYIHIYDASPLLSPSLSLSLSLSRPVRLLGNRNML